MKSLIWGLLLACSSLFAAPASKETVQQEIGLAFDRSEWTMQERRAFILSTAAHVLDLSSSVLSDERCVERNFLLGENPSNASLVSLKIVAIGFEYWLYNSHKVKSNHTHWYGYTSAIFIGATAISNFRNNCY